MDLKMFNRNEFIRIAFGDQGVSIWHDRCAGAKLGELAEKYGIDYTKMNVLLRRIKKHLSYYTDKKCCDDSDSFKEEIASIAVVYNSYKADIPAEFRQKCVNIVLEHYNDIFNFVKAPAIELMAMHGVGEKMLDYILNLRKECYKAVHVGSALAE